MGNKLFEQEAAEFWEGIQRSELRIQKCVKTNQYVFPPRQYSPYVAGGELEYVQASGRGKILSYTVVHYSALPELADRIPHVMAMIQLKEGPQMLSLLLDDDPSEVDFNQEVEAVFKNVSPDFKYPLFRIAR